MQFFDMMLFCVHWTLSGPHCATSVWLEFVFQAKYFLLCGGHHVGIILTLSVFSLLTQNDISIHKGKARCSQNVCLVLFVCNILCALPSLYVLDDGCICIWAGSCSYCNGMLGKGSKRLNSEGVHWSTDYHLSKCFKTIWKSIPLFYMSMLLCSYTKITGMTIHSRLPLLLLLLQILQLLQVLLSGWHSEAECVLVERDWFMSHSMWITLRSGGFRH